MEFQAVRVVNKNMLQKQALAFSSHAVSHKRHSKIAGHWPASTECVMSSRVLSRSRSAEVVVAVAHAPVQVDAPSRESKHGWKWSSRQGHELPYAAAESSGSRDGPNVLTLAARCPRQRTTAAAGPTRNPQTCISAVLVSKRGQINQQNDLRAGCGWELCDVDGAAQRD